MHVGVLTWGSINSGSLKKLVAYCTEQVFVNMLILKACALLPPLFNALTSALMTLQVLLTIITQELCNTA